MLVDQHDRTGCPLGKRHRLHRQDGRPQDAVQVLPNLVSPAQTLLTFEVFRFSVHFQ